MKKNLLYALILLAVPLSAQAQVESAEQIAQEKIEALDWLVGKWEWDGFVNDTTAFKTSWECEWILDETAIGCVDNGDGSYKSQFQYAYNRLNDDYFVLNMWSSSGNRVTSAAGRVFHDEGVWYEYFVLDNDSSFVTQRFVYKPGGDEIGVEGFVSVEGKPERRLHVARMIKMD